MFVMCGGSLKDKRDFHTVCVCVVHKVLFEGTSPILCTVTIHQSSIGQVSSAGPSLGRF